MNSGFYCSGIPIPSTGSGIDVLFINNKAPDVSVIAICRVQVFN